MPTNIRTVLDQGLDQSTNGVADDRQAGLVFRRIPTSNGAFDMTFEPLSSDFYGFEAALTEQEKDSLMELRAWLDAEVRPHANDLWAKAEFFPRSVVDGLAKLGMFGSPWEETQRFPNSAVYRGWVALELARCDASVATLVGMQNGLVMG